MGPDDDVGFEYHNGDLLCADCESDYPPYDPADYERFDDDGM